MKWKPHVALDGCLLKQSREVPIRRGTAQRGTAQRGSDGWMQFELGTNGGYNSTFTIDRRKDRWIRDKGRIGQLVWSRGGRRDHAIRRASLSAWTLGTYKLG
jgi:hypothetical protein